MYVYDYNTKECLKDQFGSSCFHWLLISFLKVFRVRAFSSSTHSFFFFFFFFPPNIAFLQNLNSYTNGAYGPPYPTGPGTNPASYSGAYYTPGYAQTSYSTEVPSTYRSPGNSPTPVSRWMYPQQDCQTEAPPLRGQVSGYPASQVSMFLWWFYLLV